MKMEEITVAITDIKSFDYVGETDYSTINDPKPVDEVMVLPMIDFHLTMPR